MRWLWVIVGGAFLGIAAYRVQVNDLFSPHERAVAQVAIGWTFMSVGLLAWVRRPANVLGPLLVAAGAFWLARQLRYADSALLFTLFFLLGDLCYAFVGHAVLAYPSGRVRGRLDRGIMFAGYTTAVALPAGGAAALRRPVAPRAAAAGPARQPDRDRRAAHGRSSCCRRPEVILFFGVLATLLLVRDRAAARDRDAAGAPHARAPARRGASRSRCARYSSACSSSSTGRSPTTTSSGGRSSP